MTSPIRTAVFPVAGLGTRFLPATKATPKELLPVIDVTARSSTNSSALITSAMLHQS